jgi:hypothetical protein
MAIQTVLIFDIIGILIGLVSIFVVSGLKSKIGGSMGKAFNLFIAGILSMMLAFLYTIVFSRLKLLTAPHIDVHHLIMTVGLIFFMLAAMKFANLTK